jgi:hypothetical protein
MLIVILLKIVAPNQTAVTAVNVAVLQQVVSMQLNSALTIVCVR